MSEFSNRLEGEMRNPEQTAALEMSQEAREALDALFGDDYGGAEFRAEIHDENPCQDATQEKAIDLTKQYEPNARLEIDGKLCETDGYGYIYKIDGQLLPNCEYTIGRVTYKTDEYGRIILCDGDAVLTPEGERDNKAQTMAGGEDRKEGDQGGHILARIFGGAKGIENMLAMRGTAINQSVYKRMENEIGKALEEGKEVHIHVEIKYDGDSKRPSRITVIYTIDGKKTEVQFDNDEGSVKLLETVEDKIEESDYNDLENEIEDANKDGANMSVVSVKTEYDEEGNISKVTVTIRDENSEHPVNEDRVFIPKEAA